MSDSNSSVTSPSPSRALVRRLLNLLATPGEVFDEVVSARWNVSNWTAPTLLVCLTGIVFGLRGASSGPAPALLQPLAQSGQAPTVEAQFLAGVWPLIASFTICAGAFGGSLWAAFVLWFIGRVFLKTRFPFVKALEIAGLTAIILVLGTVVTALLAAVTGDASARPALSLFALKMDAHATVRKTLELFNFFHLWSTAVLAGGLSRLAGVTYKEAAFWVFGYWLLVRVALVLAV